MNILITAPSLNPKVNVSGISTVVTNIINNNHKHNYIHYQLGSPDRNLGKIPRILRIAKQLIIFPIILKRSKVELVHQNLPFDPKGVSREFAINTWCRLLNIPVVLHIHGGIFLMNHTPNFVFKRLAGILFKSSRDVIVLSEIEKDSLSEKYNFNSARILYNSIDTTPYAKPFDKIKKQHKPILLFLGRIHESKGIDDIIEALKLLKERFEFQFVLCGEGPLKESTISACKDILQNNFEYKGIISGNEKLNTIKESTLFLLPSRYGEGLPMALLETMAAGVVPVVTDDASMKYVVHHKENGIRVQKNNPNDLLEKLQEILSDQPLYHKLSNNARETILKNYDIKNYIVQLNEIYDHSTK